MLSLSFRTVPTNTLSRLFDTEIKPFIAYGTEALRNFKIILHSFVKLGTTHSYTFSLLKQILLMFYAATVTLYVANV